MHPAILQDPRELVAAVRGRAASIAALLAGQGGNAAGAHWGVSMEGAQRKWSVCWGCCGLAHARQNEGQPGEGVLSCGLWPTYRQTLEPHPGAACGLRAANLYLHTADTAVPLLARWMQPRCCALRLTCCRPLVSSTGMAGAEPRRWTWATAAPGTSGESRTCMARSAVARYRYLALPCQLTRHRVLAGLLASGQVVTRQ